jgi:hypothetical protein
MAHYYEPGSPHYIPAYNHSHTLPADYISPNSPAAQLGLTPADMAPILQEQQELMRDEACTATRLDLPPTTTTTHQPNHHLHHLT